MKMETNEKSLKVINEGSIFYKIKSFFNRLFYCKSQISSKFEDNNTVLVSDKKEVFNESLKINIDTSIIDLQTQLKQGKIKMDDLSNEETDRLIKLYKQQINEKKVRLKEIKSKIINIKARLL